MNIHRNTLSAFSIIEVLIGIFVFSLGLVSIYALLASSLNVNDYNRNSIIASNLAREQIELFRNIRDTNYKKLQVWNQLEPHTQNFSQIFSPGDYYTLENNVVSGYVDVENKWSSVPEWPWEIADMQDIYGLCLNADDIYSYDCAWGEIAAFYRYLYIEEISVWSYQITSKVIWYKRWYHEYEIQTIVTDWRRI